MPAPKSWTSAWAAPRWCTSRHPILRQTAASWSRPATTRPTTTGSRSCARRRGRSVPTQGLLDIRKLAESDERAIAAKRWHAHARQYFRAYIDHLVSYVDVDAAEAAEARRQSGQRWRRHRDGRLEEEAAVRIHRRELRAGRHLPERHPQPDAAREPGGDIRGGHRAQSRHGHRLGRRFRSLLPVRRERPVHRGLLHRRAAGREHSRRRTRAARSSTIRA